MRPCRSNRPDMHANPTRRDILRLSLLLGAGLSIAPRTAMAIGAREMREVGLNNIHTGEAGRFVYYDAGTYQPQALSAMTHLLRDFRNDALHPIDPLLFDMLYLLQSQTESRETFEVISGYRSPETNQRLYETTEGVNPHSLHMQGRAIDIRLPGASLDVLASRAAEMQMGGVGLYPASHFVHLDTGAVQRW